MSFVSTNLGKVTSITRSTASRLPRLDFRLRGMGDLGAAAGARKVSVIRPRVLRGMDDMGATVSRRPVLRANMRLRGMGDLGRAVATRNAAMRRGFALRGLGETSCSIDPITGGRVCTSGPAGASSSTPAAVTPVPFTGCSGSVTPRYLPDPTTQQWAWNNPTPASWIFQGRPDVNSVYDIYVRQDGAAYAAVGPGGGFMYNDPRRAAVAAYGPCTPAPVATPTTPAPVVDASSGAPATIQPVAPSSALPSPMLASTAPAMVPASGTNWSKIALYGGIGIGGYLLLKMLGIVKH